MSEALDTRTILNYQRVLISLIFLVLPKPSRQNLKKQFKNLILEDCTESKNDGRDNDSFDDFSLEKMLADQARGQILAADGDSNPVGESILNGSGSSDLHHQPDRIIDLGPAVMGRLSRKFDDPDTVFEDSR